MNNLLFSDNPDNAIDDYDSRFERLSRRPRPLWRLVGASIYDFLLLVREARVALIGFIIVATVSTCYLLFLYDDTPNSGMVFDRGYVALYETMKLMTLESDLPIPEDDLIGEILFFTLPILGLALVFQSVLNFGRLLLDKGARREAWQISLARMYRDHIIICGLGSVSYRVTMQLLEAGYHVVVVDHNWNSEFVEAALALKVPVIQGDARNHKILRHAGINRAHSLIAGTHEDLINIEIALAARRRRANLPVVLRIFNDELDTNLERSFGRNTAFSASALAAPTLAAAALGRAIAHVLPLPEGFRAGTSTPRFLGILQITLSPASPLHGVGQQIEDRYNVRILRHLDQDGRLKRHNGRRKNYHPQAVLEAGDMVLMLGTPVELEQIRALNHQGGDGADEPHQRIFSPTPQPGSDVCYDTVIVCGLGKIGYRVVRALHRTEPRPRIVVICEESHTPGPFVEAMQELGVEVLLGDARRVETLHAAGIDHACSVAAVTSNDLVNLQIGLAARRTYHDIDIVLRVSSAVLADRLTTMFGVHTTFSISALAAPTLAAAAVVRGIDYAIEIAEHILSTITLVVRAGDQFAGRSISEVREREEMLVVALRRGGEPLVPIALDTRLQAGDEVVVLVDIARLQRLHLHHLAELAPGDDQRRTTDDGRRTTEQHVGQQ